MPSRRTLLAAAAIIVAAALAYPGAAPRASVQTPDICWDPDVEFPTTCEDDE